MLVQLQEGGVSLTIQHQSGKLDTAIRYTESTLELSAQLRETPHKAPDVSQHVQATRIRSQVQRQHVAHGAGHQGDSQGELRSFVNSLQQQINLNIESRKTKWC